MHSINIAHRDLKLDNILINVKEKIKLIDYGFAILSDKEERINGCCGTPYYMDPDLAANRSYIAQAGDVWALGVCMFILLTGRQPFAAKCETDLYRKIIAGKYKFPKDMYQLNNQGRVYQISDDAKCLIQKMLNKNARQRISAS